MAVRLRHWNPVDPDQLLSGSLGSWIRLTLYCALFITLVNAVFGTFPHFKQNSHAKKLATVLGIILGVSLFLAEKLMNFSLESFSFLSIWFVIILMGMAAFGLFRMGMSIQKAIALSFCIIYLSFMAVSPGVFDTIAQFFPPLNGILLLLLIISFFYLGYSFIRKLFPDSPSKNLGKIANKLKTQKFDAADDVEINNEIKDEKQEEKDIKKGPVKITKTEIKTLDDMHKILADMNKTIKLKSNGIDQQEIAQITSDLRSLAQKEAILTKGMTLLKQHTSAYNRLHKKDIAELQQRLQKNQDKNQQEILQQELKWQQQMLNIIQFLEKNESQVLNFQKSFNSLIWTAMQKLKSPHPVDALNYLVQAESNISDMRHIYNQQKKYENFLKKTAKKTILSLKSERKS